MKGELKRIISFIAGGIVAVLIVGFFRDEYYLSWNVFFRVVIIALIGSFIGYNLRRFVKKVKN
ncbi:hypothetical protein [Virgibacillus senegalensis]|uniref:hypothetical protein n=1 Tax=Virgibacillus senegalensis TaxID=1499679 RepID=UPI00069F2392|nr:hypothetical protein [Virgibacillus senegalensis]